MASAPVSSEVQGPVVLICGDDEFTIKQRSRQLFERWRGELGGDDHEIIDAGCANASQASDAVSRLREAINTRSFFGGAKVVWFKDCSFLGEDRTSGSAAVTGALGDLAKSLKEFRWDGVRLLVSAGKPDKKRVFFKWLEATGRVEWYAALSADDKDWATRAEGEVIKAIRSAGKDIRDDALAECVARVGPNLRALINEVEKVILYVGDRKTVTVDDIRAITTQQKQAQAFALGEALGDRDLPRLLRLLDRELGEIRTGVEKGKSEIGVLYGLISKVRAMLLMRETRDRSLLKPVSDYSAFRAQVERIPSGQLPEDRRFNPLAGHPYVAFQAFRQSDNYAISELNRAMELLLDANLKLVGSSMDEGAVLRQALVEIVGTQPREKSRRQVS